MNKDRLPLQPLHSRFLPLLRLDPVLTLKCPYRRIHWRMFVHSRKLSVFLPSYKFIVNSRPLARGAYLYICKHELCQNPPFFSQSPVGLYLHVWRKHLRMALACPYCKCKLFWKSKGLLQHMDKHHTDVPHYGHQVAEEAQLGTQMLEQVKEDPEVFTK